MFLDSFFLLQVIYLDYYINCTMTGIQPKKCIMFFKTETQLIKVQNYLKEKLSMIDATTAPFVSYVGSTLPYTELVILSRKSEYSLVLTNQKLMMGQTGQSSILPSSSDQ